MLMQVGVRAQNTQSTQKGQAEQNSKNVTNSSINKKIDKKTDRSRVFDYIFYDAITAKNMQDFGSSFDALKYNFEMDSTNTAVAYELANYYAALNDDDMAMDMYRIAAEGFPDNFVYASTYALVSLQKGETQRAINIFERLTQTNPDNQSVYYYLAESYKVEKEYEKAIEALAKIENLSGLNEKISLDKYELYKLLGEEKKAFAEIEQYIEKYPNDSDYYVLLGDLYMQEDEQDKAEPYYLKAKELNPNNPYVIVSLSAYYDKVGKVDLSQKIIEEAILNKNIDVDTKLDMVASSAAEKGEKVKTDFRTNALLDTLVIMYPQEPKLNLIYGNFLVVQGKIDEAREQYITYTDANPKNPAGWEQLIYTTLPKETNLTVEYANQALQHLPEEAQFYYFSGVGNYMEKNYDDAISALQKGLDYIPKENTRLISDFWGQIGDIEHQMGEKDKAYSSYEEALKFNPNNFMVLNNYSYFLSLERKKLDKAEKMISAAVKANPTNHTFLDTYGWVLFEQGSYSLAKFYIESSLENSPNDEDEPISAEVLEHYGDVLYKTDEKEKALEYWNKAKETLQKEEDAKPNPVLDKKIETGTYIKSLDENNNKNIDESSTQ